MARRGVRLVLICEDREHERFARHAFLRLGFHRRELRFLTSPSGRGAANHWILNRYADEVRAHRHRSSSQKVGLVTVIDADKKTVAERHKQFSDQLKNAALPARSDDECIVLWVPRRHIETWVAYLRGEKVDEEMDCTRLAPDTAYPSAAASFIQRYRQKSDRPKNLLPSIATAFDETDRLRVR